MVEPSDLSVNETQVRRGGRLIDDERAAEALRDGDVAGAGSVQQGATDAERAERADDGETTTRETKTSGRGR